MIDGANRQMPVPASRRMTGFSSSQAAHTSPPQRQNQRHRGITAACRQPKDQLLCEKLRLRLDHYQSYKNNQLQRSRAEADPHAGSKVKAEDRNQYVRFQYLQVETNSEMSKLQIRTNTTGTRRSSGQPNSSRLRVFVVIAKSDLIGAGRMRHNRRYLCEQLSAHSSWPRLRSSPSRPRRARLPRTPAAPGPTS